MSSRSNDSVRTNGENIAIKQFRSLTPNLQRLDQSTARGRAASELRSQHLRNLRGGIDARPLRRLGLQSVHFLSAIRLFSSVGGPCFGPASKTVDDRFISELDSLHNPAMPP